MDEVVVGGRGSERNSLSGHLLAFAMDANLVQSAIVS